MLEGVGLGVSGRKSAATELVRAQFPQMDRNYGQPARRPEHSGGRTQSSRRAGCGERGGLGGALPLNGRVLPQKSSQRLGPCALKVVALGQEEAGPLSPPPAPPAESQPRSGGQVRPGSAEMGGASWCQLVLLARGDSEATGTPGHACTPEAPGNRAVLTGLRPLTGTQVAGTLMCSPLSRQVPSPSDPETAGQCWHTAPGAAVRPLPGDRAVTLCLQGLGLSLGPHLGTPP